MTVGWPRGGGSRIVIPSAWPTIGNEKKHKITKARQVPWSYLMVRTTIIYTILQGSVGVPTTLHYTVLHQLMQLSLNLFLLFDLECMHAQLLFSLV